MQEKVKDIMLNNKSKPNKKSVMSARDREKYCRQSQIDKKER